jgi:hypothetical protein
MRALKIISTFCAFVLLAVATPAAEADRQGIALAPGATNLGNVVLAGPGIPLTQLSAIDLQRRSGSRWVAARARPVEFSLRGPTGVVRVPIDGEARRALRKKGSLFVRAFATVSQRSGNPVEVASGTRSVRR